MIINKVKPYWTEEENKALFDVRLEQNNIIELVGAEHAREATGLQIGEYKLEEWHTLEERATQILKTVEDRYIKDRKTKGLLEDTEEIVEAITKEDYLAYTSEKLAQIATLKKEGMAEESLDTLRELAVESYDNCYHFILYYLRAQLNGLAETQTGTDKAISIIERKVAQWYVKPQPTHFTVPYSKPTDALAFMSQKRATIDAISGDAVIDRFSVQVTIAKFKEMKASLGISTDKLLETALGVFARNNDFSRGSSTASNRRVVIPLKEYASMLGYDVSKKHALDNARKKIQKDLDILYNISFDWEESINNRVERFIRVRLLSNAIYSRGDIAITFTPEMADHLVARGLLTQYNTKLLGIDERHPNAYYIMRKLEEHYNIDTNQRNNRNDRIGVETLLAVTDLPSYEEVMKQDRHWVRRIKEPLEENLEYLYREGLLADWYYTHSKGVPLTDEEVQDLIDNPDYNKYSKLYILFIPADKVDHTGRQKRRAEREAKRKTRKKPRS